jgi:hypothetical protein
MVLMLVQELTMQKIATYWAPLGPDGYGADRFAAPVPIKCRWEDSVSDQTGMARGVGEMTVSNATVFTVTRLSQYGWLFLGESSAPSPMRVKGAYKISTVVSIESLGGEYIANTVYL